AGNGPLSNGCKSVVSALALLLRAQGVPSRVVVGYHGGQYNHFGKFYDVRQLDAHAWVEAYLERDEHPEALRDQVTASGAWLRLDPTPPAFRYAAGVSPSRLAEASNYLESIWNDHVLGLNSSRQKRGIYAPLIERARAMTAPVRALVRDLADQRIWRYFARNLVGSRGIDSPDARFPWRTVLVVLLLGVSLILLVRLAWRLALQRGYGRRMRAWLARSRSSARGPSRGAPFYRRFERLLARRRFRRQSGQTQQEFARHVARRLGTSHEAAPLLDRVIEAFYRVRFGERPLDAAEAQAIENTLDQLERTLARRHS
ncbi:MAG: transglutaminase domain-containing protein, partial [Planctomycetes bacterium]|nr:transglutaminase domain-containing protein [Planctomycetota bacterium]